MNDEPTFGVEKRLKKVECQQFQIAFTRNDFVLIDDLTALFLFWEFLLEQPRSYYSYMTLTLHLERGWEEKLTTLLEFVDA